MILHDTMILHEFSMGDVEDPYLYAAFPIGDWQETEQGRWVMTNIIGEATFHCIPDMHNYGYRVVITGELSPTNQTYFNLKWGIQ